MKAYFGLSVALIIVACESNETAVTPSAAPPPQSPAASQVGVANSGSSAQPSLKPSYVLCESGGQLRWFINARTIGELFNPQPDPWKMDVYLNGSPYSEHEAKKALAQGWCTLTDSDTSSPVVVLEDCNGTLPLPNGGCRKVSVGSREWYTFGDAIALP